MVLQEERECVCVCVRAFERATESLGGNIQPIKCNKLSSTGLWRKLTSAM